MTAQKSTNNFKANFLFRMKSNRKISIIVLLLHLFAGPAVLIDIMVYLMQQKKYYANTIPVGPAPMLNEVYTAVAIMATIIAILCGIAIAVNNFSYLYRKSNVDMFLALPLTKKQRFFSDFTAGIASYLAPFLASGVVTMILSFFVQGMDRSHDEDLFPPNIPVPEIAAKLILFGFFIMLMVYVLTVLSLTICGTLADAVINTIALNAAIPATIFLLYQTIYTGLYGIETEAIVLPLIFRTSPIGGLIYVSAFLYSEEQNPFTYWLIPFILVTAVFFALSYFLFTKRKAEQVSKPFVFRAFYHTIMALITFVITAYFFLTNNDFAEFIIPLIILTAIFWLIVEVVQNKGFKHIGKAGIRYAITLASVIMVIIVGKNSEGFGAVYRVPDADNVKSVSIDYFGAGGAFSFGSYTEDQNRENTDDMITLRDKESINAVISAQKSNLERYKANEYNTEWPSDIKIVYNLKNGGKMTRTYQLTRSEYKLLSAIDRRPEYINLKINILEKSLKSDVRISGNSTIHLFNYPFTQEEPKNLYIDSYAKADEFVAAYTADLKSLSDDEYFYMCENPRYLIHFNGGSISINGKFTRTLALFDK